jgi:hypothetical protein
MTIKKFFGFAILLWFFLAVVKVVFIKILDLDSRALEYVYWLLMAMFSIALARRLGAISFLEAMLVATFWFLVNVILDFLVTSIAVGFLILSRWEVWVGYAVMLVSIFFFHKKRHIVIRKELAAHHQEHH